MILLCNKQLYSKARAAKLGHAMLPDVLERLRLWVCEIYSVNVLYVAYDRIDIGPQANRPRLNLILETADDFAQLRNDRFSPKPTVERTILKQFATIVAESDSPQMYDTEDAFIGFYDFSNAAMEEATVRFEQNHRKRVIEEFSRCHLWDIDGVSTEIVVFYLTDEDVRINAATGTSHMIAQRCYELVKEFDEFDYFTLDNLPISFDSKENLDAKYHGNMDAYFR